MDKISFSVILPTFNSAKTIKRSLDSIVNQKYSNAQVVIVDKNSSDGTREIVKEYSKVLNIKYINAPKAKIAEARNIAIKNSDNEYLLFIDSDDYFYPGLFETLNSELQKEKVDVIRYQALRKEVSGTSDEIRNLYVSNSHSKTDGKTAVKFLEDNGKMFGPLWLCCYKKEFFTADKFKFLKNCLHEDLLSYAKLPFAKSFVIIDFVGYQYEKRENNLTSIKSEREEKKRAKNIIKVYDKIIKIISRKLKDDPEYYNWYKWVVFDLLNYNKKYFKNENLKYYQKQMNKRKNKLL